MSDDAVRVGARPASDAPCSHPILPRAATSRPQQQAKPLETIHHTHVVVVGSGRGRVRMGQWAVCPEQYS